MAMAASRWKATDRMQSNVLWRGARSPGLQAYERLLAVPVSL